MLTHSTDPAVYAGSREFARGTSMERFGMFSGKINCMGCGHEAIVEIQGIVIPSPVTDKNKYFRYKPSTGYLYFPCTSCGVDLEIDPLEVMNSRVLRGIPVSSHASYVPSEKMASFSI